MLRPKNYSLGNVLLPVFLWLFSSTVFSQTIIDTLIVEDFTGGATPANWTIVDHISSNEVWQFNNPGGRTFGGNFDSDFAIVDSDYLEGLQNTSLVTPTFDLSVYSSSTQVFLKFDYQYFHVSGSSTALEIFDGTNWITVKSYSNNAPSVNTEIIDIASYLGNIANAQVRLTYVGDYSWWWAIDNFEIIAVYSDADSDGIADDDDADADNDGIPNDVEGSCDAYSLVFEDLWSLHDDPVTVTPSSPLVFGQTIVTLDRRDPQNIIAYGAGTTPDPDSTGIATQNSILSYKIIQNSTTTDSSEHIFRFNKPVMDLVIGVVDVDKGSNFTDHIVVNGYAGDTIYTIQSIDALPGPYTTFNQGDNSFTGVSETENNDAISQVTFPVLIDSVIVIYSNKKVGPTDHQAIIFNASFSFCDIRDADGDRIPDYLDLDSDNDGIPDLIEIGGVDTDGDGRVDDNTDLDGDGIAGTFDNDDNDSNTTTSNLLVNGTDAMNSDTDTIPDYLDLDADNDGISDIVEAGGIDTDGDGYVDDLNANGQLINDMDNDGFTDMYDPDNNDTLGVDPGSDSEPLVETDTNANHFNGETGESQDTDNDGLPDHLDLDADNDAIPDLVEAGGIDTNGDGRVDNATDADNDGYADIYDTNDDGIDGVEDTTDALLQTGGTDTDGDGKADDTAITFNNGQGNNKDTDGDGIIDGLDLDADDDGIPDHVEAGAVSDPENDGMVDTAAFPWDADGDGLADFYDENTNDGPASTGGNQNGTSLVETTNDTNGDGIVNNGENMASGGNGTNNTNTDQDAYPNHLDLDADNDGITDVVENASGDINADNTSGNLDGIVGDNPNVTDTDNNGWHDPSNSSTTDNDGDGNPDFLDVDADNDGIVDYLEGVCSTCPTFVVPSGPDTDGNGVLDIYEDLTGTNQNGGTNVGTTPNEDNDDGTNPPDYLDTDTDEDTAMDWTEGYDANDNGIAIDDIITMAAAYETANGNPGDYPTTDTDSDGIPDWLDNDPTNPGYDETARPPFLDGTSSDWIDVDNDGLVAIFDTDEKGTAAPTPDNNGGNDNDWRDQTALVLLPVELVEFSAFGQDCNIVLKWLTASEEKFSHFEIERGTDGFVFETITSIAGRGDAQQNIYNFVDNTTIQGVNYYYRLKMVDLNSTYEHSDIINLTSNCEGVNFNFNIFPNPVTNNLEVVTLELKANDREWNVRITDMIGKTWYQGEVEIFQQILKIDISKIPSGNYNIIISNEGWIDTKKLIIVN